MDSFLMSTFIILLVFVFDLSLSCVPTHTTTTPTPFIKSRECAANLIQITRIGPESKDMEDSIDRTGASAVRTFTCTGTNPTIEINGDQGSIQDGDDGAKDGITTFVVTCNADGTEWTNMDIVITQVECAAGK